YILADLQHRARNVISVLAAAQEDVVRQPHRFFVSGALGDRAVVRGFQVNGLCSPTQGRVLPHIYWEQRAPVYRFVEKPVTRYSFHFQGTEEGGSRHAEMLGKILEDVLIRRYGGLARIAFQESQPGSASYAFLEVLHIGEAHLVLFGQSFQLR